MMRNKTKLNKFLNFVDFISLFLTLFCITMQIDNDKAHLCNNPQYIFLTHVLETSLHHYPSASPCFCLFFLLSPSLTGQRKRKPYLPPKSATLPSFSAPTSQEAAESPFWPEQQAAELALLRQRLLQTLIALGKSLELTWVEHESGSNSNEERF